MRLKLSEVLDNDFGRNNQIGHTMKGDLEKGDSKKLATKISLQIIPRSFKIFSFLCAGFYL